MNLSGLKKWNSRKLFAAIAATALCAKFPFLVPLLKVLAPTYIVGQGAVDTAKAINAWKGSAGE